MEFKKNEHGTYVFNSVGKNVGFTNGEVYIVRGRHSTKEEFEKAFPKKKEVKVEPKKQVETKTKKVSK